MLKGLEKPLPNILLFLSDPLVGAPGTAVVKKEKMHFSFLSSFVLSTCLWLVTEGGKEGKNLEIFLQPPFPFLKSEHQMCLI